MPGRTRPIDTFAAAVAKCTAEVSLLTTTPFTFYLYEAPPFTTLYELCFVMISPGLRLDEGI